MNGPRGAVPDEPSDPAETGELRVVRTVELLLDPALDDGVRDLWRRLHAAGLRSLATHRHPTNCPHLTLLTAAEAPPSLPAPGLPIRAELGAARILGRAVVREVVAGAALRELRAQLWRSLRHAGPWPPPDEWVPHVSLALNVPPDDRDVALTLLGDLPPAYGWFVAARSYDAGARTVTGLGPARTAKDAGTGGE